MVVKPEALREEMQAEFCAACAAYWGKAPLGSRPAAKRLNLVWTDKEDNKENHE